MADQDEGSEPITLKVRDQTGEEMFFKVELLFYIKWIKILTMRTCQGEKVD